MSSRRQSREVALQVLFQREFVPQLPVRQSLELFRSHLALSEGEIWDYAEALVEGVVRFEEKIDELIASASAHWKVSRMSLVDRNILRMGTFELALAEPAVPPAVVIDEAVEIAKKYGSTDSGPFIHGVLDQIVRSQLPT